MLSETFLAATLDCSQPWHELQHQNTNKFKKNEFRYPMYIHGINHVYTGSWYSWWDEY